MYRIIRNCSCFIAGSSRGVGTATAGVALAAPLFSIKKKKKERKEKKKRKKKKTKYVCTSRIGETFLLISHNPFYNNPILTYCTNYGLNFQKALASRGLCPLTPTRGSAPWIPAGGHTPRPPSWPYHF